MSHNLTPVSEIKAQSLSQVIQIPGIQKRLDECLGQNKASFISSLISLTNSTNLSKCDPMAVMTSAMAAATLGLSINPNLGQAWIVPYNCTEKDANGRVVRIVKPQFQIGWKGYVQLAHKTNLYRKINVQEVHAGNINSYNRFTEEIEFADVDNCDGDPIAYLCYVELANGFNKILYKTIKELMAHGLRYSKSFQKGYGLWVENPQAMYKKTIIKEMLNQWCPLSTDMQTAITLDQSEVKNGGVPDYIDAVTQNEEESSLEKPVKRNKRRKKAETEAEKTNQLKEHKEVLGAIPKSQPVESVHSLTESEFETEEETAQKNIQDVDADADADADKSLEEIAKQPSEDPPSKYTKTEFEIVNKLTESTLLKQTFLDLGAEKVLKYFQDNKILDNDGSLKNDEEKIIKAYLKQFKETIQKI